MLARFINSRRASYRRFGEISDAHFVRHWDMASWRLCRKSCSACGMLVFLRFPGPQPPRKKTLCAIRLPMALSKLLFPLLQTRNSCTDSIVSRRPDNADTRAKRIRVWETIVKHWQPSMQDTPMACNLCWSSGLSSSYTGVVGARTKSTKLLKCGRDIVAAKCAAHVQSFLCAEWHTRHPSKLSKGKPIFCGLPATSLRDAAFHGNSRKHSSLCPFWRNFLWRRRVAILLDTSWFLGVTKSLRGQEHLGTKWHKTMVRAAHVACLWRGLQACRCSQHL